MAEVNLILTCAWAKHSNQKANFLILDQKVNSNHLLSTRDMEEMCFNSKTQNWKQRMKKMHHGSQPQDGWSGYVNIRYDRLAVKKRRWRQRDVYEAPTANTSLHGGRLSTSSLRSGRSMIERCGRTTSVQRCTEDSGQCGRWL